jgi:hypothetical protein
LTVVGVCGAFVLAGLLAGEEVTQLGAIGRMFAQLTDAHARRMAALGLAE